MPAPYGRKWDGTTWSAAATPQYSNQHKLWNLVSLVGYVPYTDYSADTQVFGGELKGWGVNQEVSFGELPLPDGAVGFDIWAVVSYEATSAVVLGTATAADGSPVEDAMILVRASGAHELLDLPPLGMWPRGQGAFVGTELWVPTHELESGDGAARMYALDVAGTQEWRLISTVTFEGLHLGGSYGLRAIGTGLYWATVTDKRELYFFDLEGSRSLIATESLGTMNALVAADNDGRVWISNEDGELLRSTDSGATFTKIADAIPNEIGGQSPQWSPYGMKWSDGAWYFQGGNLYTTGGALVRVIRDLDGTVTEVDSSSLNAPCGLAGVAF